MAAVLVVLGAIFATISRTLVCYGPTSSHLSAELYLSLCCSIFCYLFYRCGMLLQTASLIHDARHLALITGDLSCGSFIQSLFTLSESGGLPCINGSRISRFPDDDASLSGAEVERAWAQAVLLLFVTGKAIDGGEGTLDKKWRLVPLLTAARVIDLSATPPVIHVLSFSPLSDVNGVKTDQALHAFARCACTIQLLALEKRRKEDKPPPCAFHASTGAVAGLMATSLRGPKEWEVWLRCITNNLDWLISSFA